MYTQTLTHTFKYRHAYIDTQSYTARAFLPWAFIALHRPLCRALDILKLPTAKTGPIAESYVSAQIQAYDLPSLNTFINGFTSFNSPVSPVSS